MTKAMTRRARVVAAREIDSASKKSLMKGIFAASIKLVFEREKGSRIDAELTRFYAEVLAITPKRLKAWINVAMTARRRGCDRRETYAVLLARLVKFHPAVAEEIRNYGL